MANANFGQTSIRDRIISGAVLAVAFYLLFYAISIVFSLVGFGKIWGAITYFGSPVMWIYTLMAAKSPTSISDATGFLIGISVVAPYPLAGLLVGLIWPTHLSATWKTFRVIVIRFCWTLLIMGLFFGIVIAVAISSLKF